MEFVVFACRGCGAAVRTCQPKEPHRLCCPRCGRELLAWARPEPRVDPRWVAASMFSALAAVFLAACWVLASRPSAGLSSVESPGLTPSIALQV